MATQLDNLFFYSKIPFFFSMKNGKKLSKSKFLTLLGDLDKKELAGFGKYLRSACAGEAVNLRVFSYCKKFHPDFGDEGWADLDKIARKALDLSESARQSPRKSLQNAFHDLHGHLKTYLVSQKTADGSLESELIWLAVLRQRQGMKEAYEQAVQRLFDRVRSGPKAGSFDFLKCLVADYLDCYGGRENRPYSETALRNLDQSLEAFYRICRAKVDCEKLNLQRQKGGTGFLPIPARPLPEHPLPELYDRVLALQASDSEADYDALEQGLRDCVGQISTTELHTVFRYLKNDCTKRTRNGDEGAWEKAHQLDKFALEQGLLFNENGAMSAVQFLNIVSAAATVGAFRWGDAFVAGQLSCLPAEVRDEAAELSKAMLLLAKKQYREALKALNKLDGQRLKEPNLILRHRPMKLICAYELDRDSDGLMDDVFSFEAWLRRDSSPRGEAVKAGMQFLVFFKKLLLRKRSPQRLAAELKATTKPLHFRAWLLQKAGEL